METAPQEQTGSEPAKPTAKFKALPLAFELGYFVALPLVGLIILGRFADKLIGTSPWLMILGVVIAAALSTWIIYRKISNIFKS